MVVAGFICDAGSSICKAEVELTAQVLKYLGLCPDFGLCLVRYGCLTLDIIFHHIPHSDPSSRVRRSDEFTGSLRSVVVRGMESFWWLVGWGR